jgi:hypothetical protein
MNEFRITISAVLCFAMCLSPVSAFSDIYKCKVGENIVYQEKACASGEVEEIGIKEINSFGGMLPYKEIVGIDGKCLDAKGGSSHNGTHVILWPCHGGVNQRWSFVSGSIKGVGGKCLGLAGDPPGNGATAILQTCNGEEKQIWHIDGRAIKGIDGKCLDVRGGGSANGTAIILWPCHGGKNQSWVMREPEE